MNILFVQRTKDKIHNSLKLTCDMKVKNIIFLHLNA